MFSPLARGTAYSNGGIRLEKDLEQSYPIDPLFPKLFLKSCTNQTKSAKSFDSITNNGQILLPKTYCTRKGDLLLFTPSDEILIDDADATPKPPPSVYDDGLKLGTLRGLTSSVLEFGKEEEQAWEGIPSTPPETSRPPQNGPRPVQDKKNFLRFLHYLDSECLTADKHAQPGCDPDFYLDDLRSKSGAASSQRRFGAATPYSTRTYTSYLEDDDMSDIVREYVRYSREQASPSMTGQEDQKTEYDEDAQANTNYENYTSAAEQARHQRRVTSLMPSHHGNVSHSWGQYLIPDDMLRPRTAPLPPAPVSPRANPRISSGRPPPPKRALGSTPDNLDDILHADIAFSRYQHRGPSPRLKFSRNASSSSPYPASFTGGNLSPTFYPASSRGGSPDYGFMPRYETPVARSEDWSRADVIQEVDEQSQTSSRRSPARSVSAESRAESRFSIRSSQGRAPSGRRGSIGTTDDAMDSLHMRSDAAAFSRSASVSSVSGMSRVHTRSPSRASHGYTDLTSSPEASPSPWLHEDHAPSTRTSSAPPGGRHHRDPNTPAKSACRSLPASARGNRTIAIPSPTAVTDVSDDRSALPATAQGDDVTATSHSVSRDQDHRSLSISRQSQRSQRSRQMSGKSVLDRSCSDAQSISKQSESSQRSRQMSGKSGLDRFRSDTQSSISRQSESSQRSRKMSGKSNLDRFRSDTAIPTNRQEQESEGEGVRPASAPRSRSPSISRQSQSSQRSRQMSGKSNLDRFRTDTAIPTNRQEQESEGEGVRPASVSRSSSGADTRPTIATLGSEANINDVEVQPRAQSLEDCESDLEEEDWKEADVEWPIDVKERLGESDDEAGYGSAAEEVAIDLPVSPSPSLGNSGFFNLNSTWTPVPDVVDGAQLDENQAKADIDGVPSETGATGIQSHSPTPPLTLPTPAPPESPAVEEDDSVLSADNTSQWPPQVLSPTPPSQTGASDFTADVLHDASARPVSSASLYQEHIDLERSRPQSPLTAEEKQTPVSVGAAVARYIETGHEPQIRSRGNSRRNSVTENELVKQDKPAVDTLQTPVMPEVKVTKPNESPLKKAATKTETSGFEEKLKNESTKAVGINWTADSTSIRIPTAEQSDTRREYVNSLLIKSEPQAERGRLELEGTGKEIDEVAGDASSVNVVPKPSAAKAKKETEVPTRNDLSDLTMLLNKNKLPKSAAKIKKEVKKKKPALKPAKKEEITVDPNNIDFLAFNSPDMLEHMDDELRAFIQQDKPGSPSPDKPDGIMKTVQMAQIAPNVSPGKKGAHAPSKTKKPTKQELAKMRADARKAEKKRKEEEKKRLAEERRIREEELRELKEREEEQERAREELEAKQLAIEEEKARRLQDEDEARREEEEAMEKLKDAKKKAREERESRRAAEAERRRLEVQRKREEKRKRDEEMKEREKEMEKSKMDQEKRRQDLMDAKKRQEELDRLEEERLQEEERLRLLEDEKEQGRFEEEQIREAEEELLRLQEEREYREQMRKIAEARERKLQEEEDERKRQEEEQLRAIEDERRRLLEEEERKVREEQKRVEMARRLEAVARMRMAQEAARRKTMLLRRRERNIDRMQSLQSARQDLAVTKAFTFTYYVQVPRKIWELPIGYNSKKKRGGFRPAKKKPPPKPS